MAGKTLTLTLGLLCGTIVSSATAQDWWYDPTYPDITLEGRVRDFRATHEDFGDTEPDYGYGHYAGNISQVLGDDDAPLQVHGVTNFEITFGTLIPGEPYAARATVLGAEITSSGNPIPVTLQCETDTQLFEPYGAYNDPGGDGDVNDGTNPRHFIFSLDEVYTAETPISVTATSWLPQFSSEDFGNTSVYSDDNAEGQGNQMATLVTLPEDGTVTSITAYMYMDSNDNSDIRFAIYEDDSGEPGTLIVETSQGDQSLGWGWTTLGITNTWLTAGDYWLAVAYDPDDQLLKSENGTGGKVRMDNFNGTDGFDSDWGTSDGVWDDQSLSVYASFTSDTPTYNPHITARSGDNSQQVIVLKDGSDVPSIAAFQDQTNLAVFVAPYVNVTTGKIQIQDNQAIYLFELGTTNISSSAADFQDLVIMVTLATDPVYFLSPDSESQGFNPIGFKVNSQWKDFNGNEIAPHMYLPSWGDTDGESGDISSGGITSPSTFYEWFRDILGTNMSSVHDFTMEHEGGGIYKYDEGSFLPINGQLYGNDDGNKNWNFTYIVWARFKYDAGGNQFFEFEGGDGAWLFLDSRLLIDLGGVDSGVRQWGEVDRMGYADGQEVTMRLFYANRGKNKKFKLRTNVFLDPLPVPGTASALFD